MAGVINRLTPGPAGVETLDPVTTYLADPERRLDGLTPEPDGDPAPRAWPPPDDLDDAEPETTDLDAEDQETEPEPALVLSLAKAEPEREPVASPTEPVALADDNDAEAESAGVLVGPDGRTRRVPELIPPGWRHPKELALFWCRFGYRWSLFHLIRLPIYGGRLVLWSVPGIGRALRLLIDWATDAESKPLRLGAIDRHDVGGYALLLRQKSERTKNRHWYALGIGLAAVLVVVAGLLAEGPLRWVTVAAAVGVFGWVGRPRDAVLIDPAVITDPGARRITVDVLAKAFEDVGLADERHPITYHGKWGRDGHGYRGIIHLPPGTTADRAIRKRVELAAALHKDESTVFLSRVRGDGASAGLVELWLPDIDPYATAPVVTPLVKAEAVDFWKPFPFGTNAHGGTVAMPMIWSSLLIGALPRHGKSFAARLVVAAAALDAWVRIIVFDAKGGGDWRPFAAIAHRCGFGERTEVVKLVHQTLTEVVDDMNDRYDRIAALDADMCPESKLTPAIARSKRLNMPLVLISIDECQDYFEHDEYGDDIVDLLVKIVPDKDALPAKLRDNFSNRFALRTMTYHASEMILGSGTRAKGFDSSTLLSAHKGVGYLVGADIPEMADTGGMIVRTHYMDNKALATIIAKARGLRERAGTLTGYAAGEEPELSPVYSLLEDVAGVFEPGETWMWSETIIDRLITRSPDAYSGWDTSMFGKAAAAVECPTRNLQDPDTKKVRRGLRHEHVLEALARRLDATATPA
jgi:S-DNA-T family DNA segregation ATPase FtsK/SpoIIIE